jgi:hypothetical protein
MAKFEPYGAAVAVDIGRAHHGRARPSDPGARGLAARAARLQRQHRAVPGDTAPLGLTTAATWSLPVPAVGTQVYGNVFSHDGFFGNQTNSDLATETLSSYTPRNCLYRNADRSGRLTSAPAVTEATSADGQPCGRPGTGNDLALYDQLICATGFAPCPLPPSDANYPKQTRIVMLPLPRLPSMPDPCAGLPRNAFCS